jgi:hypothetical protein
MFTQPILEPLRLSASTHTWAHRVKSAAKVHNNNVKTNIFGKKHRQKANYYIELPGRFRFLNI